MISVRASLPASWGVAATVALLLAGCGEQNAYVPPPPPKVDVALPLKQEVTPYIQETGSAAAVNNTTLVARVEGFLEFDRIQGRRRGEEGRQALRHRAGAYKLALDQAQAEKSSADASIKDLQADMERADILVKKGVGTQQDFDKATAQRDADQAKQRQAEADIEQAQLNLSYTEVKAPFDGIVTARQVSPGALVGMGGPTTLATIVQLDPIWVNFTVSEPDVQRIRQDMVKRGITIADLKKIPVEVGLQTEKGYPHSGTLDYAAPNVDPSTGTLAVRAILPNPKRALLPGYFVRVRVPFGAQPDMLLVPDRAIGSDQSGRYVLVAGAGDVVEQKTVEIGQQVGDMRVILSGIGPEDRVIISGMLTAVPGQKIEPNLKTLPPTPPDGDTQ